MKILFVENRAKTWFWQALAAELSNEGNEIHWVVQNPLYTPKVGVPHVIPFPKRENLTPYVDPSFERISEQDRMCYFFGLTAGHYAYYSAAISNILQELMPDVVIGESTLFHERLAIRLARAIGIPYFNPSSCRYPVGRFSVYLYDTLEAIGTSGPEDVVAADIELEKTIGEGKSPPPDYMCIDRSYRARIKALFALAMYRAKSLLGWVVGERYNTPGPLKKFLTEIERRKCQKIWEEISVPVAELKSQDRGVVVLYPLQMQPEANLDVWAYPYNNQTRNVKYILGMLPRNGVLWLKPNPKSKYELNSELLEVVSLDPRVRVVSHDVRMSDLATAADYIFSETGTVTIEGLCRRQKVISRSMPVVLRHYPECAEALAEGKFPEKRPSFPDGAVVAEQRARSFEGIISDPMLVPSCTSPENIQRVIRGIRVAFKEFRSCA